MLFQWCSKCEFAFQTLKDALCTKPTLKFPDPQKPYVLFTDASKYAWAGVLTQLYTKETEGKVVTTHHPVTYVSGLFRGSQLNWAALTEEAYAIYMSVKKLSFYLTDAEITLRSDHLPLQCFLLEQEGYEFGYSCFEELLPVEVFAVEEKVMKDVSLWPDKEIGIPEFECTLPVPKRKLCHLQLKDEMCQKRARQVHMGTDSSKLYYINKDDICGNYWKIMKKYSRQQCCQRYLLILYYSWLTIQWDTMGFNGSTCQFDGCTIGII